MPVPSVNVSVDVFDQNGVALQNAEVFAELVGLDTYNNQLVGPIKQTVLTDVNGHAEVPLFPNALGERNSFYRFKVTRPDGRKLLDTTAMVPNNPCNLKTIAGNLSQVYLQDKPFQVQPYSAILTGLASVVGVNGKLVMFTGPESFGLTDLTVTTYSKTLLEAVDAPTWRTLLGLGTAAAVLFASLTLGAGAVAAPSLNLGSAQTGLYQPAADQIGVTIAGVQKGLWTSTGLNSTAIGASTPSTGSFTTGTFSTSVVTPLVNASGGTFTLQAGGVTGLLLSTTQLVISQDYITSSDNTFVIGTAAGRIKQVFTPILDSGFGSLVLNGAGTTALTATGANLVAAGTLTQSATGAFFLNTAAGTSAKYFALSSTGANFNTGIESSVGGSVFAGSTAYANVFGSGNATPIQFFTNNILRHTIDSSGNQTMTGTLTVSGGTSGADSILLPSTTGGIGLTIGGDTNLYRVSANILATDDTFLVETIRSAGATATVFNTIATTVNAFGAASVVLNIGHASGLATISGGIKVPNVGTTATAANAFIDNADGNRVLRSTSSLRYKDVLGELLLEDARHIVLKARAIVYKPKEGGRDHIGLAAEWMAELDERVVTYDALGRPDWVQYPHLTAPLMLVAQDHEARIKALETAVLH
jgi:hypothetical protein